MLLPTSSELIDRVELKLNNAYQGPKKHPTPTENIPGLGRIRRPPNENVSMNIGGIGSTAFGNIASPHNTPTPSLLLPSYSTIVTCIRQTFRRNVSNPIVYCGGLSLHAIPRISYRSGIPQSLGNGSEPLCGL